MKLADFQEKLSHVPEKARPRVEKALKYLVEDAADFKEISETLKYIDDIVKEQIKKVDTNKFE